jgi:dipeptidyl aminopeptidase/acylaminoacyl peptidase
VRCLRLLLVSLAGLAACAHHVVPGHTASTSVLAPVVSAKAQPYQTLIPRGVLFGNPDRTNVQLSADGRLIAFLAPDEGVLNLWVAPVEQPAEAHVVTHDRERGVRVYFWSYTNDDLLYLQDQKGDENFHLLQVHLPDATCRDLVPIEGVRVEVLGVSPRRPSTIVVGVNDRDPAFHDIYTIDLGSAEKKLVYKNIEGFAGFFLDHDLEPRLAARMTGEGGIAFFGARKDDNGVLTWAPLFEVGREDALTTSPFMFDTTGKVLYLSDSRGRDTSAAASLELATGKVTVLAEDARADLADVVIHPSTYAIQAASFNYDRQSWKVLDASIRPDLEALAKVSDGDPSIVDRSLDDKRWIVAYDRDRGPVRYYLYEHETRQATYLFSNRSGLEGLASQGSLAAMHPELIRSRDGRTLVSYLTLPPASDPLGSGKPSAPVPLVLWVHGGPWARDTWGYNPTHQWLANRGYAVLSVNYRGSTGLGKAFTNAGDGEWGAKMEDDLLDAEKWAVDQGITRADSVAVGGGSYGGYATLAGLTLTPDSFACGVDIVGPSNLRTLLDSIPAYWQPIFEMFASRVGDPRTDAGRALLEARSPLSMVDRIRRPLLIGQGANDPRVKQAESDQIVKAMEERGIPVTYVLYSDEGHGFVRPENRTSFNAVTEAFLSGCLGGAFEPVGRDFGGSSIEVPKGASLVPGLAAALVEAAKTPATPAPAP